MERLIGAQKALWEVFPLSIRLFRGLSAEDAQRLGAPMRVSAQPPILSLSVDALDLVEALESDWQALERPEAAALLTEAALAIGKGLLPSLSGEWVDSWRERLCTLYRDATVRFIAADPALCLKTRAERPFAGGAPRVAEPPTAGFYGRTTELEELQRLLQDGERVVSLVGLGGAGKTRLALELLQNLPERIQDWAVARVSLGGVTTRGGLLEALRKGLGQQTGDILQDGRDPLGPICRALHDPTILYLDNVEDAVRDADGDVVQSLSYLAYRCPETILLSTSRCRIGLPEEFVFPVEGLSLPTEEEQSRLSLDELLSAYPGLQMLGNAVKDIAGIGLTEANLSTFLELLRLGGGLPLCIELLAARVGAGTELPTPEEIKTSAGSPRGAIDWALGSLSDATRDFLLRLSVFSGAFRTEDAEIVTGELESGYRLAELDDAGLLSVLPLEGPAYQLPTAVRDLARENLESSGLLEPLLERHADHFASLTEQGEIGLRGVERVSWIARLSHAHADIVVAIQNRLRIDSQVEVAAKMFTSFSSFLLIDSRPHEGIDIANRINRRILQIDGVSERIQVEVRDALGRCQLVGGFNTEAEVNLKQVFPFRIADNDIRARARCANNIAVSLDKQKRYTESVPYYDVAWKGFNELGERFPVAQILQNMASGLNDTGDWQAACDSLKKACEIVVTDFPGQSLIAKFLFDYAEALFVLGKFNDATETVKEILQVVSDSEHNLRMAHTLMLFGLIQEKSGTCDQDLMDKCLVMGWAYYVEHPAVRGFDEIVFSQIEEFITRKNLKELPVCGENDLVSLKNRVLAF